MNVFVNCLGFINCFMMAQVIWNCVFQQTTKGNLLLPELHCDRSDDIAGLRGPII